MGVVAVFSYLGVVHISVPNGLEASGSSQEGLGTRLCRVRQRHCVVKVRLQSKILEAMSDDS